MAVAIATNALTTVATARNFLGRAGSDPTETDKLQIYINAYSNAIMRYTGRQFLPTQSATARRYRYDGSSFLSLAPSEATAISAVTLYTDLTEASWLELAPQSATVESRYRAEPRNGTQEGTYLWLALPEIGQFNALMNEPVVTRRMLGHEVTITGDWGAGVVPADVELAALIAIANAFRNPEGFGSRSTAGLQFAEMAEPPTSDESGLSLPRGARSLLTPYRRTAYG